MTMSIPDNSRRPRMLKEFLQDDTNSSGLLLRHPHSGNLVRSRSSRTRSAFQSLLNKLIKNNPFSAVNSPSNKHNKTDNNGQVKIITVRVKDIIRWKSFRDLVEDKPQPLDLSPLRCTTTTTTTTTSGSCSSTGSSWCDSDFTSEYLPDDDEDGKNNLPSVGSDYQELEATNWVGPEEDVASDEEKEQHSPVSVLDFETRDGEEPFSRSRQSFEEESVWRSCEWGLLGHTKEWCVREMDKGGRWSKFDEEQQEVCLEIENDLFTSFIDDLFRDLVVSCP